MSERCASCGFAWDQVAELEIADRAQGAVAETARLLRDHPGIASDRPEQGRWSMLEYGGHMRDVLLGLRDRFVVGLVEDDPGFKPM